MINEFKQFLLRGNVVDLAVGVVIGAAFNSIVQSLVKDIITPLIAAVGGEHNFAALHFTVHHSSVMYGNFINAAISFLIVAVAIFFGVVKPMNALLSRANRGKEEVPVTRKCPECLSQIPKEASRCLYCTAKSAPQQS